MPADLSSTVDLSRIPSHQYGNLRQPHAKFLPWHQTPQTSSLLLAGHSGTAVQTYVPGKTHPVSLAPSLTNIQGTHSNIANSSRSPNIGTLGDVALPMNSGGYSKVFASTRAPTPVSSSRNCMSHTDACIHRAILCATIVLRRMNHTGLGSPWVVIALTTIGIRTRQRQSHHRKTPSQLYYLYSWHIVLWHWPHQLLFEQPHGTLQIHAPPAGHPSPRHYWQVWSQQHCWRRRMGISQNLKGHVQATPGWHPPE